MGCLISSLACCFCFNSAALCCSCVPSCKSSTSARLMYGVLLTVGTVLACLSLIPGLRDSLSKIPAFCDPVKIWTINTNIYSGTNCDLFVGLSAVYRLCFGLACIFFLLCLLMICVHSSRDPRSKLQNGFWFFKFLIYIAIVIASFFIPAASSFEKVWMYFGIVGGFIFIFVQMILLVDFAHGWNKAWLENFSEGGRGCFYACLLGFTLMFYVLSLTGVVLLYVFYAHSTMCGLNIFFVTFNISVCIGLSVLSVLPAVQDRLPHSGLLQSSLLTLYTVYMTWSAMSNAPNPSCNPLVVMSSGNATSINSSQTQSVSIVQLSFDGSIVVSLIIFLLTLFYYTSRSGANTAAGELTLSGTENTKLSDKDGGPSQVEEGGAQTVWDDEENGVAYDYSAFHALCLFASLYIMMTLTNWYGLDTQNQLNTLTVSMAPTWVKMVSIWVGLFIYFWTLVAPLIFRDRDFS